MMPHRRWQDIRRHEYGLADRDRRVYWCECDKPMPKPTTIFGVAMGGYQECQRCGRPIAGSELTNPHGTTATSMLIALTSTQRLVFAVVGFVFVLVFIVWPVVRPPRPKQVDEQRAWHRLMREIRRQR